MVTVRKSVPKSRNGCQTCKIRHVKCDETQPRCQRCTSTGRTCDGYGSPSSPINGSPFLNALATRTRRTSDSEDVQERRSFEYFRSGTVPSLCGYFGSPTWNLVLQACAKEPAVSQAAIALGAFHERLSTPARDMTQGVESTLYIPDLNGPRGIETDFPIRQYAQALGELRKYLSTTKELDLDVILICALIYISIEGMQNHYDNALVHLENSLQLLQSFKSRQSSASSLPTIKYTQDSIQTDLSRAFLRLDLQASGFAGMRPPAMSENQIEMQIPGRFSSLIQAKDVLDQITGHLYFFHHTVMEEYKYRKQEDFPLDAIVEAARIQNQFKVWNERFEKYLQRPTSKFSRQEQLVIDVLVIHHRFNSIEAATSVQPEAMIFDNFDAEFDEIVTLAANVIRSRRSSVALDFQLDIGVIQPLYWTAVKCREPWIRQRAMSLLRSIDFQEGVWISTVQAAIAQVVINREGAFPDEAAPGTRPAEFARVHCVGVEILDLTKRLAEVHLGQKLNGLDGPWHYHVEWCSW